MCAHDDPVLERAFTWLCHRRRHYPADADIWSFRQHWVEEKPRLQADLRAGRFRFGLLSRITDTHGESIDVWAARDALVLKALTWLLAERLPLSRRCTHLKGHGGGKGAVRAVRKHVPRHRFVCRTDVASYYASIDHGLLLDRLVRFVPERGILNLVGQYLTRTAEWGGLYFAARQGISRGCPLSPLIGAFFLHELGIQMQAVGVFYVRFMDDVLVLASTRWKLRHATQVVNRVLSGLRLAKHPDKTFIGRIAKGFDFLGYHFSPTGLKVAAPTVARFVARVHRLYEQEQREPDGPRLLGAYVRRWRGWARGGIYPERDAPEERTDRGPWALTFAYGQGTRGPWSALLGCLLLGAAAPIPSQSCC